MTNYISKSEKITEGLRKSFQSTDSKVANRVCYGYTAQADGELDINEAEAATVRWIFARYIIGDSLGKIATGLEKNGIPLDFLDGISVFGGNRQLRSAGAFSRGEMVQKLLAEMHGNTTLQPHPFVQSVKSKSLARSFTRLPCKTHTLCATIRLCMRARSFSLHRFSNSEGVGKVA